MSSTDPITPRSLSGLSVPIEELTPADFSLDPAQIQEQKEILYQIDQIAGNRDRHISLSEYLDFSREGHLLFPSPPSLWALDQIRSRLLSKIGAVDLTAEGETIALIQPALSPPEGGGAAWRRSRFERRGEDFLLQNSDWFNGKWGWVASLVNYHPVNEATDKVTAQFFTRDGRHQAEVTTSAEYLDLLEGPGDFALFTTGFMNAPREDRKTWLYEVQNRYRTVEERWIVDLERALATSNSKRRRTCSARFGPVWSVLRQRRTETSGNDP